jgi:hypothetical protein
LGTKAGAQTNSLRYIIRHHRSTRSSMNRKLQQPTTDSSILTSILCCALLFGVAASAFAQKVRPGKQIDLKHLQSKFESAVGKDFEVVKGEFKERSNARGGGSYWLAHIKPKHPGSFALTYRYNYNDPHYSHVERTFNLNVGRTGCSRGVPSYGSYHRFCLGDTIIFPVAINNFTEHEFTLTSTAYTPEQDATWEKFGAEPTNTPWDESTVSNPLADHLRYVGRSSYRALHRNGGYTLEGYAMFEAQSPGRFNLALSATFPDPASAVLSSVGDGGGKSIIIVPRETPVTLLASSHGVQGYTTGYDGKEFVRSTSGDSYMVNLIILQPGDRISFKYYTTVRSARQERNEPTSHTGPDVIPPPQISKLPFAVNAEHDFTEWLIDYLPR